MITHTAFEFGTNHLKYYCENRNDIIIAGDFNNDWQSEFYKSKLKSILNDNGMKEFTGIMKNSKTI